jgi:hypothetical protein
MSSTSEADTRNSQPSSALLWTISFLLISESHFYTFFSTAITHLGGVDKLISQALGYGLDVTECSFTSTSAQQPDGLVDASQR